MAKKLIALVLLFFMLCPAAFGVNAPYDGYYYDSWGETQTCPNIYTPKYEYFQVDMGMETALNNPSDMYMDEENALVYIADTGNNRIVVLDKDFFYAGEITHYTENGESRPLKGPEGVSLDADGNLLIADTANRQVIRISLDGTLLNKYTQPDSALYPEEILFLPEKVATDLENNVYALVPSIYQGVVLFSKDGEFLNFFGGNTVNITPALLFDYYWKKLLSEEQAEKMARYVPINYLSMDMSKDGYMYVTLYSDTTKKQIKKLNPLGNDILRVETEEKAKYGDLDILYYNGSRVDTQLTDICVSGREFIYALDSSRGRVFVYSQNSASLGVFGGSGRQTGLFSAACAIDTMGDRVYVLDNVRASITEFSMTQYGSDVLKATELYEKGEYEASEDLWRELLKKNMHLEIAYDGVGKALLAENEYEEALPYFKKANDVYWYSKAFQEYRVELVRSILTYVLIAAAVVLVIYFLFGKAIKKRRKKKEKKITAVRLALKTILHPVSGFEDIREYNLYSAPFAGLILGLWFFIEIILYQYTGFIFNGHKPDSINVILILASTAGLFILLVFVNNALSTFMDGESTLKKLWISAAYALLPMLILKLVSLGLSYFLTMEEGVFRTIINVSAYVWMFINVIFAVKTMQQYTFKKTIVNLVFTFVGLLIVLFIAFLFFSLIQQVFSFVKTIFDEIMLFE